MNQMRIEIRYLVDGARDAKGAVVIIDVLRACTTIPILFENGAKEIVPVSAPEEAHKYEEEGYVLVGEGAHGHAHDAFHHINSPSEVVNEDFADKSIVLRSNNATQAILSADKADEILLASFVNLRAVVDYIKKRNPDTVTLVALGRLGKRGLEDDECAEAIKSLLKEEHYDFEDMKKRVSVCDCAMLVRDTLGKPKDVVMSLEVDSFPIVPRVYTKDDFKYIKPVSQKV